MGQYAGQPDFGTIAANLTPSNVISSATNLNQACIYIGGPAPIANITCILSGVTGIQGVATLLNPRAPGTGYVTANGLAVTPASGQGTGLTVNITAVNGAITVIAIATAGSAYREGDIITVVQAGGSNGEFFVNTIDALPQQEMR